MVLVAKREELTDRTFKAKNEDERTLVEWVLMQEQFRLPLDEVDDLFKLKIANTLIEMYGDPIIKELHMHEPTKTQVQRCDAMFDEILHDMHSRVVCHLTASDWFGEQASLRDTTRTASIRCTEDTHLAYIEKEDFLRIYNSIMKAKQDKRIQFLKAVPLFSPLSKHYLMKMTSMFHRKDYIRN